jgi:hypothetical protein
MYAMSKAFTRSQILFVGWMLAFPVVTLIAMWFFDQPHSETVRYLAPLIVLAVIVGVTVAALVIGAATGTKRVSTIGLLVGVPVSFVLAIVVGGAIGGYRDAVVEKENAEIRKMLPAFKSGNKQAIAQAIGQRESASAAWLMCVLARGPVSDQNPIFDDGYVLPIDALMQASEALAQADLPLAQKEAGLFLALEGMMERDAAAFFPAWIILWDKAHRSKNGKAIVFSSAYDEKGKYCRWGSTAQLAGDVVERWGDAGVVAWLDSGHSFVGEQRRIVLLGIKKSETLEKLLASGIHFGTADGGQGESYFPAYVEELRQLMRYGPDPHEAVKLLATFLKAAPPTKTGAAELKAACDGFIASRPEFDDSTPPGHKEASLAFEKLLCPVPNA